MSALANNTTGPATEPATTFAKAAAVPETITVGTMKPFNNGKSVIVQGVTEKKELAEVKVWNTNVSNIHVGTKLFLNRVTKNPTPNEFQQKMVCKWNEKGYTVAGGGLWVCQSAEVDPSGPHYQTCFVGTTPNEPGIFSGKVEAIDTEMKTSTERGDFEKTIFTITGTEGSECKFPMTKSNAETKAVSVGDTVAFFAVDTGFPPFLDPILYAQSIVFPPKSETETTTTPETTTPKEETTTPKEETTTPKETPKEETTTLKEETTYTTSNEKVLEEAVGVKRQVDSPDSPSLSSLKRSKSMAQ